jgi:hypothetical protein
MLTIFAIQVGYNIVEKTLEGTVMGALTLFAITVLGVFVGAGITLISLEIARGRHATYADVLPDWHLVLKFFIAVTIAGILISLPIVIAGAIALAKLISVYGLDGLRTVALSIADLSQRHETEQASILMSRVLSQLGGLECAVLALGTVTSIYLAVRYAFVRFAVLDGESITGSLKRSMMLTKGHVGRLLGLLVVLIAINILGAIVFVVGLLVSVPISIVAYAHVYLKLKDHHHARG